MDFKRYMHLERYGNSLVEGIDQGTVYVFPKLDGTNASIWKGEDGSILSGSRNRLLSETKDNAGFCSWVKNQEVYKSFFSSYPDLRLYGEWLVPHTLKTYREDAWRRFYIFDVVDASGDYLHYEDYSPLLEQYQLDYLGPMCIVKNGSADNFYKVVNENKYLIKDGEGLGEGIVLKNYNYKNKFGKTVWAKIIHNEFKENHYKVMGAPIVGTDSVEVKIAEKYVTRHLVEKTYNKILEQNGEFSSKSIPQLLNAVYYDLITEELWDILKDLKQPSIDFKYLQRLTIAEIKKNKPELF